MTDQQPRLVDTGNDSFEVVEVSVTILTSPKDGNSTFVASVLIRLDARRGEGRFLRAFPSRDCFLRKI